MLVMPAASTVVATRADHAAEKAAFAALYAAVDRCEADSRRRISCLPVWARAMIKVSRSPRDRASAKILSSVATRKVWR